MTTTSDFCSKCGVFVNADDAFCPECGTEVKSRILPQFNWEPKEQRHPPAPPVFFGQKVIPPETVSRVAYHVARKQGTATVSEPKFNTTATAGIMIIATLLGFSFWFGVAIGAFAALSPPESERIDFNLYVQGDYLTGVRVFWAAFLAAIATLFTWMAAITIADK